MTVFRDERTEAQKTTHRLAIVATDKVLSGWGQARNGKSYAGWAFKDDDYIAWLEWVESRSDMQRVRLVTLDGYRPNAEHTHIYVYRGN